MPSAPDDADRAGRSLTLARVRTGSYFAGAILVLCAAWLFVPRTRRAGVPLTTCVVDASASALRLRPSWRAGLATALAREARTAHDAGSDFAVVAFDADVRRVFGPGPAADYLARSAANERALDVAPSLSRDSASCLARALSLARDLAGAPDRSRGRVVLFADGAWTGDDPRPMLSALADDGVAIDVRALPPEEQVDVALDRLEVPRSIESGAPLVARVAVAVSGPGDVQVDVDLACTGALDGVHRRRTFPVRSDVPRDALGRRALTCDVELGVAMAGRTAVRASVRVRRSATDEPGDPIPENDQASASVVGSGAISVAIVSPDRDQVRTTPAFQSLTAGVLQGLQISAVAIADLPRALDDIDVLVTDGVAPSALPRDLIAAFLRRGGGWLACAGLEWLEPNARESALALAPLQPAADDADARDLVLLVDGSGSMAGAPYDAVRAALLHVAEVAPLGGRIDLRIFGAALGAPLPIRARGDVDAHGARARLAEALPRSAPGGPTRLFDALEELARTRAVDAPPLLGIVLSDGLDATAKDPRTRASGVRDGLARARIELAAIAAGEGADHELLASLASEVIAVTERGPASESSIEHWFMRRITSDRVRHSSPFQYVIRPVPSAAVGSLARALLDAQSASSAGDWPTIESFVRTRATPGAEVVWVAADGMPLFAIERHGTGLCAASAFSPIRLQGALYAPILRALGRGAHERSPWIGERDGRLVVEDLPLDAPVRIEAHLARAPTGGETSAPREITVQLSPDGTLGDIRRTRSAPWPNEIDAETDTGLLGASLGGVGAEPRWRLALDVPRPREFRVSPDRVCDLRAYAASLPAGAHARALGQGHPAAPFVLALGLACLAGAVATGSLRRPLPRSGLA